MSHQGRYSAIQAVAFAILLFHIGTTHATVFIVGDSSGWDFSAGNWTNGKNFKGGDILVFNYDSSQHNVMVVDVSGYNGCRASSSSLTYSSGKDQVKLSKGRHFFICSIPGHCAGGLKMSVNAS